MRKLISSAALCLALLGCGSGSDSHSNYVGTFKSVNKDTGQTLMITIAQDDGTKYVGNANNTAISGAWGQDELTKGPDMNTIYYDFRWSAPGVTYRVSGTALRQ